MLGISTTNLRVNGFRGKGLSTEAQTWRTNIIANGGTIPDATLAIFDNYFFKPAKANGNILSELDRLNIYCGLVGYEIAARTNVIKSAHYVTPVSSPTFDNNGYKSSGTSYLNLNYNPNTQGVKLIQNSAFHFCHVLNPGFAATERSLGANNGTERLELLRFTTDLTSFTNGGFAANTNKITTGKVFLAGRRPNSTTAESIINSNLVSNSTASIGIPPFNVYELTVNSANTPVGNYDTKSHLSSGHGSSNVDYTSLKIILDNLYTALGL